MVFFSPPGGGLLVREGTTLMRVSIGCSPAFSPALSVERTPAPGGSAWLPPCGDALGVPVFLPDSSAKPPPALNATTIVATETNGEPQTVLL